MWHPVVPGSECIQPSDILYTVVSLLGGYNLQECGISSMHGGPGLFLCLRLILLDYSYVVFAFRVMFFFEWWVL